MSKSEVSESWILEEVQMANLGDKRLNKRFGHVLELLSRDPRESIPSTSRSWGETKAAYRFFDNGHVTLEKILEPHKAAALKRIKEEKVILLLQDTTELDYSTQSTIQGLGPLNSETHRGLLLHPLLAVTPERLCLGVVNAEVLIREKLGVSAQNRTIPIEKKESMRWLKSYRVAQEISHEVPGTTVVSVSDREGDIYEIFLEAMKAKPEGRAEWIIRGSQNRLLTEKPKKKLFEKIHEAPVLGEIEFELHRDNQGRKSRRVKQEIRAATVELKPAYRPGRTGEPFPSVSINVVLASEIDAPEGVEAVEWILLTSLSIATQEEAIRVINWYLCRWQIEIFFRILKTGCEVEELQLKSLERLKPCIAMYLIIAWRILYITMLGRSYPDLACNLVFEEEEWHAIYIVTYRRPPPEIPPTLDTMIRMLAGLGGFLNRKSDGDPGPKSVWIGLQRMRDFIIGMEALNASKKSYG